MQRYYFSIKKSDALEDIGYRHLLIILTAAAAFAAAGIAGLKFQTEIAGLYFIIPVLFLITIFILAIMALRHFGYKGSLAPVQSMMLLMIIGLLLQVRMHVTEVKTFTESGETITVHENVSTKSVVPMKHIRNQAAAYSVAVILVVMAVMFGRPALFKWLGRKYMILFVSALTLIGLLILLVKITGGGKFLAGMTPWEPVRIIIPVAMAGFLAQNSRLFRLYDNGRLNLPLAGWGPFIVLLAVLFSLFIFLGDLGQLMIFSALTVILLYVASGSVMYPAVSLLVLIGAVYSVQYLLPFLPEYAAGRIELWYDFWNGFPSEAWWNRSYQTANALFALQAGGLTGTGIGLGFPELVPLSRSDFVYAEIAEELGFVGSCAIILLYLSIVLNGLHTANHCVRRFDYLAVTALSLFFGLQVFINLGGVINFIPLTGIALPFLSKGGFSVITFAFIVGIIMTVSHNNTVQQNRLHDR